MPALELAGLEASFHILSVAAVIFCSLSALFGAYLVLFVLAIWATYRRKDVAQKRLRIVTIVLFLTLLTHYGSRAVQFGRSRLMVPPSNEQRLVDVPLLFVSALTTTFACFISDGLLAWRFYHVFERRRWALYIPVTAISVTCLFGIAEDCLFLSLYHSSADYIHLEPSAFKMNVAWGWATFAINTVMTLAIMAKILLVCRASPQPMMGQNRIHYGIILEAISESALVTWVGLILLEIASLAPTKGHVTDRMNFGYVIDCILPIFFGISQCLITTRLGFAGGDSRSKVSTAQLSTFIADNSYKSRSRTARTVSRDTMSSYTGNSVAEQETKMEVVRAL
ncbi:hypothetical protein BDY19DRAFT_942208 [Irpex rosettiformis]|uniref:Uncharacterized protein n=1 Tax=Irpex rosettiformis TaxID=378272 RepID=A0ACB8U558_9APHY|nr:hypothetical protein BDY19DRAFT_942208 [Irpex rosettiformis]